jgi:uncharacterized protein with HEPN domain
MNQRSIKRLEDAAEACTKIADFTRDQTFEEFLCSDLLRSAVERQLEIIGEALGMASREDPSVEDHIPEIPRIVALRNRLIHGYDSVDPELVWDLVKTKTPSLVEQLRAALGKSWKTPAATPAPSSSLIPAPTKPSRPA